MGHVRMYATALTVLLIPAGLGVVTVHASPTCEKFVRTYVTVPVRNRVSKTTALAWAKWREGHPNWKPNPAVHRPRYKMTQKEALSKVALACEVPTVPQTPDLMFKPADFDGPTPAVDLPPAFTPVETTDVAPPGLIPPLVAENPPVTDSPFPPPTYFTPPFIPPVYGGGQVPPTPPTPQTSTTTTTTTVPVVPVSPVPEPSTLMLLATGAASSLGMMMRRQRAAL